MPRHPRTVKTKLIGQTSRLIDLHFHGALGVDLMHEKSLDRLKDFSAELAKSGMQAICPTTLSAPIDELIPVVETLGSWIRSSAHQPGCRAVGIHLEGPFLSPDARGAHPERAITAFSPEKLLKLWDASRRTLKILTLAPETLSDADQKWLGAWASKNRVRLSMGHTRCTAAQAESAVRAGFSGITHLWNAHSYHHRDPGLFQALQPGSSMIAELIPDGAHVAPYWRDHFLKHFPKQIALVSDATPAAGLPEGPFTSFGPLKVQVREGASRTGDGGLAGGGYLLPEMVARLLSEKSRERAPAQDLIALLKILGEAASTTPERALLLKSGQKKPAKTRLFWYLDPKTGAVTFELTRPKKKST